MTFLDYTKLTPGATLALTELGSKDSFKLIMDTLQNKMSVKIDQEAVNKCSNSTKEVVIEISRRFVGKAQFVDILDLLMLSRVLGHGPKVFRPTALQLRYLEQMDINVSVSDFHMPFSEIVIELPSDYTETKVVENPFKDGSLAKAGPTHRPAFSVMLFDKDNGFYCHSLTMSNGSGLKGWWYPQPDWTLEEWLKVAEDSIKHTTEEELRLETDVRRAILNYCLLLDEVGIKQDGPHNPNEYNQLVKWCGKKFNEHTIKNRLRKQLHPMIYSLNKEVKLHVVVKSHGDLPSEETGVKMPPHHRRGHYRMQRYGVGLSEKKRIRVPPVFVNSHMLTGDKPNVVYKT